MASILENNVDLSTEEVQESFHQSEQRYRIFFEHSMIGMAATSPNKECIQVNDRLCEMLGYSREELTKKTWEQITHKDDLVEQIALYNSVLNGEHDEYELDKRFIHRDGHTVYTHLASRCIRKQDGSINYFITMVEDISERKQVEEKLRESSQILQNILETTLDGFWSVDYHGNLIDVNQTYAEQSGYTREELLLMQISQLDAIQSISTIDERINTIIEQRHIQFETKHRRKDGSIWDVEISASHYTISGGRIFVFLRDITERKSSDNRLLKSEKRFRNFFEKNSSIMLLVNPESGKIEEANNAAVSYYGYPKQQLIDMPISHINILQPDKLNMNIQLALHENSNYFIFSHRLSSGEIRDVEVHSTPIEIDNKTLLFSIVHDITERKQAEEKLHLAANVFTHASEGIVITSPDGAIIDINDAFSRTTGYIRDEIIGKNPRVLSSKLQGKEFYSAMWHDLIEKGHWYGELWNRRKNGELYAEMLNISSILDSQGKVQNYVGIFSDITANKEHEHQLEYIAHYDPLTGLPNRVLNSDRLRQAMTHADHRNEKIAVIYLDLDGFKQVNDRYSHSVGDNLLIALSRRMQQALREGDTLSRLGGDEFVAILLNTDDISIASPIIQKLLDAASQVIVLDDVLLQVSASIGVTFYPQSGDVDADQLIRQADQAMYEAKQAGKNRYDVFDPEHDLTIRTRHKKLERIRQALKNDEFVLYYQPKINMRTGELIGVEALIRWKHPEEGLIPPLEFLPIIENHPLSVKVGEWVINEAIFQIKHWKAQGLILPVSVNVGALQLLQGNFVERLRLILAQHENFDFSLLEIEVLETSALEDVNLASSIIEECKRMGIHFALDDFGTGYSSLTYLKRLPVKTLKIDQSFVRDMLDDQDDLAILEGIVGLASSFGREVIAEGVETHEHGKQLLLLGCDLAQGYGIARPMPAEKMIEWAQQWGQEHGWIV